jgi:hypothetical protein
MVGKLKYNNMKLTSNYMVSLKRGSMNYGRIVRASNETHAIKLAKQYYRGFKVESATLWGTSMFVSL